MGNRSTLQHIARFGCNKASAVCKTPLTCASMRKSVSHVPRLDHTCAKRGRGNTKRLTVSVCRRPVVAHRRSHRGVQGITLA
jgi:hypothetical protein